MSRQATKAMLLLALLSAGTRLARAEVVRLEALETRAVARRATLGVQRARVEAARADVAVARSAYYPNFSLNFDAMAAPGGRLIRVRDDNGDEYRVQGSRALGEPNAFDPQLRYGATLALVQNVFDFGRTSAAVRAAESNIEAAQSDASAAGARVVVEVRAAYLAWLGATLMERAASEGVKQAVSLREHVVQRVAEGVRPAADVLAAEREVALAELEELRMRGRLQAARIELERVSGAPLPEDASPDLGLLEQAGPLLRNQGVSDAAVLRRKAEAARALSRMYEQRRAPAITASAEAGIRGQSDDLFTYYRVGGQLTIPLWDGGAESGRARAAGAQADEAIAQSRELESALAGARALAQSDLENAADRLRIARRLAEVAARQVADAKERYEQGVGTLDAVLEAQGEQRRAEQEIGSARVLRLDAALRLRR